ncbi:hypothetical protein HJC22_42125 [Corallococcus exiguus]|uniref:hypothetical protein n=1 Tax=Corallococcus TaxID=83461 RepID=UPI000EA2979B|nr:hypothetical protein [Corallococcus sp. CA041A]NNC22301.1 hypothetical protein [Corallococcus exiguus]NRD57286.1 hypothetical protein [Corallococcus exiguus]RKH18162.1 hypothetical protein D7V77_34615 [Corallococcus sp. CA041A]
MDSVTTHPFITFAPVMPQEARADTHAALVSFFQDFGFTGRNDLEKLAGWVLGTRELSLSPEAALALARWRVEGWLAEVLGPSHVGPSLMVRGRAAFVLVGGARWGADVLMRAPSSLPEAWRRAVCEAVPMSAPAEVPCQMREQVLVLNPFMDMLRRWLRPAAGQAGVSPSR